MVCIFENMLIMNNKKWVKKKKNRIHRSISHYCLTQSHPCPFRDHEKKHCAIKKVKIDKWHGINVEGGDLWRAYTYIHYSQKNIYFCGYEFVYIYIKVKRRWLEGGIGDRIKRGWVSREGVYIWCWQKQGWVG